MRLTHATKLQGSLQFIAQDLQGTHGPGFAGGDGPIQGCSTQQNTLSAQGQGFADVAAAAGVAAELKWPNDLLVDGALPAEQRTILEDFASSSPGGPADARWRDGIGRAVVYLALALPESHLA